MNLVFGRQMLVLYPLFKRRFFIGLLSSVQYLSTISTVQSYFMFLQDNCGLNACKRRLLSYSLGW